MNRRLWLGLLLATAVGVGVAVLPMLYVAAATDCRLFSVDGDAYSKANRAVLETIPVFPGSELVNTGSMGAPADDRCFPLGDNGPPYESFDTYANYDTPNRATPDETLTFYDRYFVPRGWARSAVLRMSCSGRASHTREAMCRWCCESSFLATHSR